MNLPSSLSRCYGYKSTVCGGSTPMRRAKVSAMLRARPLASSAFGSRDTRTLHASCTLTRSGDGLSTTKPLRRNAAPAHNRGVNTPSARARSSGCALLASAVLVHASFAQGPAPSPLFSPAPEASPSAVAATAPPPAVTPELTRADLEPFLDGLINSQIDNRDVAGAVVSVVRDGQVVLAKGYGFADFAERKPVVADETLFRPGSISKLFNAIAVMQLVEAGKLDLDRDVREYLDFDIARRFPEPITLRRLLTHTAGFEESIKNLFGTGDKPMPLREYLIAHMPAQIFRPGTTPAYSNYGVAVAGYIVERVSGQSLAQYLAQHVFQPLGMSSSTFEQPLPEPLAGRFSKGYLGGSRPAKPFEICNAAPAGALSTTATDMARFMIATLNGGTLDGATVLRPETLATMQSRQHELHPDLRAMGLGFIEYTRNGLQMWGHAGDTILFHSDLFLIPNARVGVYLSYNSAGGKPGSGRGEVLRTFLDRYFPQATPATTALPEAAAHGREVSGVYEYSRRSETNLLRLMAMLGQVRVTSDREGVLTIENSRNFRGGTKRWREVAPYSYREIDGVDRVAFVRDEKGGGARMLPNFPVGVADRVTGMQSKSCCSRSSAAASRSSVLRSFSGRSPRSCAGATAGRLPPRRSTRLLHRLARVVCLLIVAMVVVLAIPFSKGPTDVSFVGEKVNPYLTLSHILGWLACAGLILLLFTTFRFWRTAGLGWWPRVHMTLLTLAVLVFLWFAWAFHLLSPSLNF